MQPPPSQHRSRLRVLVVLDAFRLGGAETLIAQLARVAPAADLDLEVLSVLGPAPDRTRLAPMLAEAGLEPQYLGARRTADPVAFGRLVRRIRQDPPDVVHAHLEMAMTLAMPAAALAKVPAVGTFHHVYRPLSGRAAARERLAVEVATRGHAAIFVSQASLRSFADQYRPGQPPPPSWTVVHNGIDLAYFAPAAADAKVPLPADLGLAGHRVVTIVAALRDFKGIGHAVRAWPAVVARHPDARLLLVGSGEKEADLRGEVAAQGVEASVVFAGLRTDIPAVLRGSDIALLPSIYGENLPTVLMEAGACARPVVASDVGGIRDIVADGDTGLLVPPGDSAGLAAALTGLLDDPVRAARLGAQGRERIEQHFDARRWAENLRAVYERAIANEPVGRAPERRSDERTRPFVSRGTTPLDPRRRRGAFAKSDDDGGKSARQASEQIGRRRPVVVVVAEAAPMRGGIATFAETITADPALLASYDMRLLNTARTANREGGRFSLANVRQVLVDAWRTFRAAQTADVVHLQLVADPGLPALRAAALNLAGSAGRARLIAHVHSAVGNAGRPELARYGRLDRLALRTLGRADLVCTVSDAGTRTMRGLAARTPVRTVDNAIDVAAWTPTRPDRVPPTVLFVGVICRRKGTCELARAARLLRERGLTDWRLVVVGGPGPTPAPEYAEIVAEFAVAGLADSLVGPEHGEQVRTRLREADIFVLPSFLEGQPIAIIEAMAAGVPVVGTTIGAIPDLIRDGREGLVVEPGDVAALADALAALITDPARRVRMGRAVRERAEAAHSLPRLSAELDRAYASVLSPTCQRGWSPERPPTLTSRESGVS